MDRRERVTGAVVFTAASLFYLFHTGSQTFWLDSAEFVTVAKQAGIAHPPGTPLYSLLAHFFTLVPLGPVVFRVHLFNVLLGGAVAGLLFAVGLRLVRQMPASPWVRLLVPAVVALAAALTPGIWLQSVRAEVYALNSVVRLAMVLTFLFWLEKPDRAKYPALMALLGGLGLANHHLLIGLTGIVCLGIALVHGQLRKKLLSRFLVWLVMLGIAGLLTYLYLVVRAGDGWLMWGNPRTIAGFFEMLSAKAFHISVTEMPRAPIPVALLIILESWVKLLGWPLFLAGFAGLSLMLWHDHWRGSLLLLLVLAGALSKAIMYLDVENPDDHAYFLTGIQGLALGSLGLLWFPALFRRKWRSIAAVGGVGTAVSASLASAVMLYIGYQPLCDLSKLTGPDSINRHFHERVVPEAVFMPSYYATYFNHLYYRMAEQRRPDVVMIHQSLYSRFSGGRAYGQDIMARHPDTIPLFAEYFESGNFPLDSILELSKTREILLENDTVEVTLQDVPHLKQFALGSGGLPLAAQKLAFAGPGVLLDIPHRLNWHEGEIQKEFWTSFYQGLEGRGRVHPELGKLLTWYHYRNALFFLNKRAGRRALLEVQLARQLQPDSGRLFKFEQALLGAAAK
jgi:hypothetical protein